ACLSALFPRLRLGLRQHGGQLVGLVGGELGRVRERDATGAVTHAPLGPRRNVEPMGVQHTRNLGSGLIGHDGLPSHSLRERQRGGEGGGADLGVVLGEPRIELGQVGVADGCEALVGVPSHGGAVELSDALSRKCPAHRRRHLTLRRAPVGGGLVGGHRGTSIPKNCRTARASAPPLAPSIAAWRASTSAVAGSITTSRESTVNSALHCSKAGPVLATCNQRSRAYPVRTSSVVGV